MRRILSLAIMLMSLPSFAETLLGVARNNKNEIVYLESHNVEVDDSGLNKMIQVEYKKPDGRVFAVMKSDFSKSKTVPDTTFEDSRFNVKTQVRTVANSVEFEDFKNEKSVFKKTVPLEDSMVLSQGFDNFIKMNFTKLSSQKIEFKFGVLERKDFFSLTGYKIPSPSEAEEFGIRASHWLARLFVRELKVAYDAKTKRLKSYAGISNIMDDSGKSLNVKIDYQWVGAK